MLTLLAMLVGLTLHRFSALRQDRVLGLLDELSHIVDDGLEKVEEVQVQLVLRERLLVEGIVLLFIIGRGLVLVDFICDLSE